ncbi:uncharacterized protein [Miscanthus floridulus]|uniref:uncharacterized protein n=1 Tax=Miscanthus floridulus TaxID=154761 RepID=UPI0034575034
MAPACILLDRTVAFRSHPEETEPFDLGERAERVLGAERAKGLVGATTAELPKLPSREDIEASIAKYLLTMTPDLEVVEPPDVSCLTMRRPLSSEPIPNHGWSLRDGAVAAAADKNLVVLYPGSYHPAYSYNRWYLLLDLGTDASSSSSLSAIPGIRLEYSDCYRTTGYGAVIMTREGGAFVLAELLFDFHRRGLPAQGMLCLWQSSLCSWVYKHGELPAEVHRTWRTHMSFPVQSRNRNLFCWVDLLHGLLLWDLGRHCEVDSSDWLDVSFVPLPHGCSISDQHPQEYRNMACVDGTIKFLNMEGGPISLVTYALDLDKPSPSWMVDTKLLLKDLWKDKTFISKDVPQIPPLFPILSTLEHDVVYLVIPGDVEHVEGYPVRGVKFLLSVDTCKTRVISATQQKHPRALVRWRYLLAASVSHSQLGSKYHQGAVEAIGMGASGKRMKFE